MKAWERDWPREREEELEVRVHLCGWRQEECMKTRKETKGDEEKEGEGAL